MTFAFRSSSPEQTQKLGERLGARLRGQELILISGGLGSGKTVLAKGIASALGVDPAEVASPSYVIMNRYRGRWPLFHFDLYRLGEESRLIVDEIDETLSQGVVLVEWAQYLQEGCFADHGLIEVELEVAGESERRLVVSTELDYLDLA